MERGEHRHGSDRHGRSGGPPPAGARPHWGKIVIARHGKPALSPRDRHPPMRAADYRAFWSRYDLSGLAADQSPPAALGTATFDAHHAFASALIRTQETARAVLSDRIVPEVDAIFAEAALPPPPLLGARLKPRLWGIVSRLAWRLGRAGGMESHKAARRRAVLAAERLERIAREGRNVVLFGHGWFNRMIVRALRARGWRIRIWRGGHGYWSFRQLEHRGAGNDE